MTAQIQGKRTAPDIWHLEGVSRWMKLFLTLGKQTRIGSVTAVLPDGRRFCFRGQEPGPDATIIINRDRVAKRLLTGGNLSFAESYLDGDFDSPDLAKLAEWALVNEHALLDALLGKPWFRVMRKIFHALNTNSRRKSRKNISYHYDLGNDFYRQWLDESMTYSSALFASPEDSLQDAQHNKYRTLARRMELQPGHEVLEIGCGWGGFATFAAREIGCRVHGITISREQYEYACQRIQQEGLNEKVTVEMRDYRDVGERFDRIASIEMFEAVGEKHWPRYFSILHDRLKPGGVAGLQVITIDEQYFDDYRKTMDFIQKYIFPGGMLPTKTILRELTEKSGLLWREAEAFGQHYAETLAQWHEKFLQSWPEIRRMGFDDRFKRMWEYYLCYCEGGFRFGSIDVVQMSIARP